MQKILLTDICKPKQWKTISTSELKENGYPVYGANGIIGYYDKYNHEKETLVITCRGATCGTLNITVPYCYINGNAMALDNLNEEIIYKEYLYYYLLHRRFDDIISGSAQPQITRQNLNKIVVHYPVKEKQKKIINLIQNIEKSIEKRKQQLVDFELLVQSQFVEMFGDPVDNPMGWEQVPLSFCLDSIDNGKSFVCESIARQGDWPAILKLSAVTYGYYRPEENKAVIDEAQFIETTTVCRGDLLFTRKNTPELVGMCAYVYDTPSRLMLPDLIFRLNTTKWCNKIFLWKLINHDLFRECIRNIATGSAKSMSNISKERLLALEIILPPLEFQNQFAIFVQQVDKSKLAVQKSLEELETLKKSLMQQYFGRKEDDKNLEHTGIKSVVLQEIKEFAKKNGVKKVILFGSRARGNFERASDIDLAAEGGDVLQFKMDLKEEASTLLDFDVVDLSQKIQEKLLHSIQKEGIVIYEEI